MSGYCGFVDPAGRHPVRAVLAAMTAHLRRRGPDEERLWHDGPAALGYTHLATDGGATAPALPRTIDRRAWLTGDIRFDAVDVLQAELQEALAAAGSPTGTGAYPPDMVLQARALWDDGCVRRLHGDFSFVIWESDSRTLFGARDRFGVKPFYFAAAGGGVQISNTLSALLSHPDIAAVPDDQAVADYLLFGFSRDPARTMYRGIRRLPPGHSLTWTEEEGVQIRCYWELPAPPILRYRQADDYRARFLEVMRAAVRDRLPPDRAGLLLSGGLDSALVAVLASEAAARGDPACHLQACTFTLEQMIADETAWYAGRVASALGLPHAIVGSDADESMARPGRLPAAVPPELQGIDPGVPSITAAMASFSGYRTGLTGHGGDPALHPGPSHAGAFLRHVLLGGLPRHFVRYRFEHGHWPRLGLRRALARWTGRDLPGSEDLYPPWLERDFAQRFDTRSRWHESTCDPPRAATLRSEAHRYLSLPLWSRLFERFDPGLTGLPAELRHPFFDLRVITFLLALPPVPWCVDKELIRSVLTGRLPDEVVRRPKAPLPPIPLTVRLEEDPERPDTAEIEALLAPLSGYVDIRRYMLLWHRAEKLRAEEADWLTRPLILARWMAALDRADT